MTVFHGTVKNDVFDESSDTSSDTFDLYKGGEDTVIAGSGDDIINMGASLDAGDRLNGGAGHDVVTIHGDYSAGLRFDDLTIQNIEALRLGAGDDYSLTTADGNVAAGARLIINGAKLGAGDHLTFDGSAETDGHFLIYGGAGDDTLTGGAKADVFHLENGGNDTVHGGGGNDTFYLGGAFTSSDSIDGGSGNDTLVIAGGYDVTFGANTMTNVETLKIGDLPVNLTLNDANVASGATLAVDASNDFKTLILDVSAETNGAFAISGSQGDNTITFGQAAVLEASSFIDDVYVDDDNTSTLVLDGDFSSGVTITATAFEGVRIVQFDAGHSYDLSITGNISKPDDMYLVLDASRMGASDTMTVDLSGATSVAYTITGGADDDTVTFGGNFAAADWFNGGAGNDTLELNGDYSGSYTFGATQLSSIETLKLDDGNSYKLTMNDGNVASGATMIVDASALTGANALTFDGSAENGGFYAITGGAGNDSVTYGRYFSVSDSFDGGAGNDILNLTNFEGHITFNASTISNVEDLVINSLDLTLTTSDANVAAGATLTVDFSPTNNPSANITLDGSAETDGHFNIVGPTSAGIYSVTGGALSDTFTLGNDRAANIINGGGGDDTLTMTAPNVVGFQFDGGSGYDAIAFEGGGTVTGDVSDFVNVEKLTLDDHTWSVTTFDSNVASGQTLTVDASALGAPNVLTFDGSAETDGNFIIEFGGGFAAGDSLTGGAGADTLSLNGDYSGGYTFGASQLTSIESIVLAVGNSYDLATNDANVAAGATMTVDGSAVGSIYEFFFDGSAETDGHFAIIGGASNNILEGGAQSDTFDLTLTDFSDISGLGGNDTFTLTTRAHLLDDSIDGGSGSDTLVLNGDFSTQTALTGSNLTSIEALQLLGGSNSYNLTFADAITTALTVDASAAASLTFDATGDTTTAFTITGSAGNDTITGGGEADTFNMAGGGSDTVHGNGGNDVFNFGTSFNGGDNVDGGTGSDTLEFGIAGDFGVPSISDANISHVETLILDTTGNLNTLSIFGDLTTGGGTLSIQTNETQFFDVDLTNATTGLFNFTDNGPGHDGVLFAGNFNVGDHLSATEGATLFPSDNLSLDGDYTGANALVFTDSTISGFGGISLRGGSFDITLTDANITGAGLDIDATNLTSGTDTVTLDDTAETSSTLFFDGGAGNDVVKAGAGSALLDGWAGNDQLSGNGHDLFDGGAGTDTITINTANSVGVTVEYKAVSDSTAASGSTAPVIDTVSGVDFDNIYFAVFDAMGGNAVGAIDGPISGTLNSSAVGDSLSTDIGSNLGAYDALLFTSTGAGSYEQNHVFLVVDCNGTAGYQAGSDLVIDVTGYTGTLTTGVFYSH